MHRCHNISKISANDKISIENWRKENKANEVKGKCQQLSTMDALSQSTNGRPTKGSIPQPPQKLTMAAWYQLFICDNTIPQFPPNRLFCFFSIVSLNTLIV